MRNFLLCFGAGLLAGLFGGLFLSRYVSKPSTAQPIVQIMPSPQVAPIFRPNITLIVRPVIKDSNAHYATTTQDSFAWDNTLMIERITDTVYIPVPTPEKNKPWSMGGYGGVINNEPAIIFNLQRRF